MCADHKGWEGNLEMIFSSLVFVCVFFPVSYLLYTVMPSIPAKNALLIVASILFYAYGEPVYVFLLIGSVILNYIAGRAVEKAGNRKKAVLWLAVILNLLLLGYFKYTSFLVESINRVFHTQVKGPDIALPIGISFFTFQAISYVVDVYQGRIQAQTSFWKLLLYISFFPQLIAGPIVKYRDVFESIDERNMDAVETAAGMRRFICGLAKKVLIANAMGNTADAIFGADPAAFNALNAWLGAVAYLMQIYYDFSGYSDMAIGLGKMFGFHFRENFEYPYGALSIRDFWRRWHISLSFWFREYVYIPLGGNRRGKLRSACNRLIVFFLTGLWHGASWTFVIWGLYHGLLLLLEEFVPLLKKLPRFLGHLYTVTAVCVGFVMFRAQTIGQGAAYIVQMFTGFRQNADTMSLTLQQLTPYFCVMLVAAVIGCAPVKKLADNVRKQLDGKKERRASGILLAGVQGSTIILLIWCLMRLSGGTYNPFICFRF